MSFSFTSLVRLMALLVVGSTALAVGVSRVDPRATQPRTRQATSVANLNEYYVRASHQNPQWFDANSGRIEAVRVPAGDVVEASSLAPWVDGRGEGQFVGRWSVRSRPGPMSMCSDFGLARYAYPSGRLIDHISSDVMPVVPPAWYPGTRARILFAAGNGRLYHFAFEGPDPGPGGAERSGPDARPTPVVWGCDSPGVGDPYITDVLWGDDPRLGGCALVTLRARVTQADGQLGFDRSQIWWLRFNDSGTTVSEVGPLFAGDGAGRNERSPSLATLPDGRLVGSFLTQPEGSRSWRLNVGEVRTNPATRAPEFSPATIRQFAEPVQPSVNLFSADGRHLAAVVGTTTDQAGPARLSTEAFLFAGGGAAAPPGAVASHP